MISQKKIRRIKLGEEEMVNVLMFSEFGEDDLLPATPGSAGIDLRITGNTCLSPGRVGLYGTGVRVACPPGYYWMITLRSSMGKSLIIPNSPGVIDSDYRGEIKLRLYNIGNTALQLKRGDRVAQMILCKLPEGVTYYTDYNYNKYEAEVKRFDSEVHGENLRGEGGFGSTNT